MPWIIWREVQCISIKEASDVSMRTEVAVWASLVSGSVQALPIVLIAVVIGTIGSFPNGDMTGMSILMSTLGENMVSR